MLHLPADVVAVEIESLEYLQEIAQDDLAAHGRGQLVEVCGQNQHVVLEFLPQLLNFITQLMQIIREVRGGELENADTVKVLLDFSRARAELLG